MSLQVVASKSAALPKALANLIPASTKAQISNTPRNLYETLSRLPKDGVGARVHQTRWTSKLIDGCFWEVTRVKLKCEGKHGKAWGKLVWRGQLVTPQEERIRGALKYKWAPGFSTAHGAVSVKLPGVSVANMSPPALEEKRKAEEERKAKLESARFDSVIKKAQEGAVL